ncbi:hypothetical protein IKW72_07775 [bacterium]|nr:hypothetical protein [bacterium]
MKQFKFILFVFILPMMCFAEEYVNPPKDPPYTTNICIRLTQGDPNFEILLRKKYYPSYEVDCQIQASNCDWLVISNGVESAGEIFESYVVSVKNSFFNEPDARFVFTTTETGILNENGEYGNFDPHLNTQFTNIPGDRTVNWIVQWDAAPGGTVNVDTIPSLNIGLPDDSVKQYILYGETDNGAVSIVDSDYYRFTPTETSGKIYAAFPTPMAQCQIKIHLIQLDANNEHVTVASSINHATNFSFKPLLTFNNLDINKPAYIEVSFNHNSSQSNIDYKLAILNLQEISETINWSSGGSQITLPQAPRPVYISFKNLNSTMCFETACKQAFMIDYYDENFEKINSNKIEEINDEYNHENIIRHRIINLSLGENTIAKIKFDQIPYYACKTKLSRIKPVILIHGIDACPRTPDDDTFFGSLLDSNPFINMRPYECHDFPWSSLRSIKNTYVSKNKLRNFIKSKRGVNDLKATIVAHSAGCVMTYYECQEHNASFRENVDNIVFAAPPLLGSSLADNNMILALGATLIKRTSPGNMNLISRGTEENWERGHTYFLFNHQMISVIIGLRKYIYIKEVGTSMVDSLGKYRRYTIFPNFHSILEDLYNNASLSVDIWWDVIADSIEGISEYITGILSKCNLFLLHDNELYRLNRSDSAVGTYAAYLNNNPYFSGINSKFTDQIHSQIQRFSSNNKDFLEVVRDRLAIIEPTGE